MARPMRVDAAHKKKCPPDRSGQEDMISNRKRPAIEVGAAG